MTTYFPERVWEPTGKKGLWSSRPATRADHARRRLVSEMLESVTTKERIEAIHKLLAEEEA